MKASVWSKTSRKYHLRITEHNFLSASQLWLSFSTFQPLTQALSGLFRLQQHPYQTLHLLPLPPNPNLFQTDSGNICLVFVILLHITSCNSTSHFPARISPKFMPAPNLTHNVTATNNFTESA